MKAVLLKAMKHSFWSIFSVHCCKLQLEITLVPFLCLPLVKLLCAFDKAEGQDAGSWLSKYCIMQWLRLIRTISEY